MGNKLTLNQEGADALRQFAESIPVAVENIVSDTDHLNSVYQSIAEDLGIHTNDFAQLLLSIKKVQETAADAIEAIPPMLEACAAKIDVYIASHPTV